MLNTNAKKVIANVVPRRTGGPVKNFKEDDPRLPAAQEPILTKLEKASIKLLKALPTSNLVSAPSLGSLEEVTSRYNVLQ